MKAVELRNDKAVDELLKQGADVRTEDIDHITALDQAMADRSAGIARLLIDQGALAIVGNPEKKQKYLMDAAGIADTRLIDQILDTGVKINWQDRFGETALMHAVLAGRTENVVRLLRNGANPKLKSDKGYTALDLATQNGYPEIAVLLRKAGAKE